MIELHLIGYTEDAEELVFDLEPDGEGRYVLAVDPDLLATVERLREVRVRRGAPVDRRPVDRPVARQVSTDTDELAPAVPDGGRPETPTTIGAGPPAADPAPRRRPAPARPPAAQPARPTAATRDDAPAPPADAADEASDDGTATEDVDAGSVEPTPSLPEQPTLSPAEIQQRLRAGRSVAAVASEAGVARERIERWEAPILAERARILDEARDRPVAPARRGRLGEAVDRALARRADDPERIQWTAARRGDGRWRVSVRFAESGRTRSATWVMDPDAADVTPASQMAAELAGPARRQ